MEPAYLSLFESVRKGFDLLQRRLKMLFSGFPLARRCRGDTADRLRETRDRPERYCSGADQLTNKRIELPSLRSFVEHEKAFNPQRKHPPRASEVLLAANRQPRAVFIKNCECTSAITGISRLSEKRSLAKSVD